MYLALVVHNAVKKFGQKTAVDDLSFTVSGPGVFGLLGTNGAGKTTTIRMILGILAMDGGGIEWDGAPVSRERGSFGYLPEERGLYPKVTVADQLRYFAALRGGGRGEAAKTIAYWAGRLGVEQYLHMQAEQLSKGNQQKVQLISAILHRPRLLILDEPFSGLDPLNTELFKGVIRELEGAGCSIVLSSHQMQAVEEYCAEILLLVGGRTVLQGNLAEIKRGYGRNTLLIGGPPETLEPASELARAQGLAEKDRTAGTLEVRISGEAQAYALLRALLERGIPFERFELHAPSLHEIFLEKAGGAQ
jgi:ABC-2 type transport system ATP-binding protein